MTKVQRADLGTFTPFSDSLHAYEEDGQLEVDNASDRNLETPAWIDQCSLSLEANWQLELFLQSVPSEDVPAEEVKTEMKMECPVVNFSAPASPESSDGSYQQSGSVPRHKRPSHKRAELKRRDKIKTKLDEIKAQVPSMADKGKMSECTVLSKAAEYTKHLLGDCERFSTEAGKLRREIESLSSEIHSMQEQLPAAGLKQEVVEKTQNTNMDKLYDDYRAASIKENWKFYLFSFLMKPLFKTFKEEASTDSAEAFTASVEEWTDNRLNLLNLRHQTFEKMRDITRETDIMNNPASLREQALASVAHLSGSKTSDMDHAPAPAVLEPSEVTGMSTVTSAPAFSGLDGMSAAAALLPTFTSPHPVSSLTTQPMGQLPSPFTSPRTTSPRTTFQQGPVPQLAVRAYKPAACSKDGQNQYRVPKPILPPSRKRTSDRKSFGGFPEKETEPTPAARKRESLGRCTPPLPISPHKAGSGVAASCVVSEQQPMRGVQVDMNDVGQLAVSVEETSLHVSPPIAVVTPTLPLLAQLPTSVTQLISGCQYQEYDFDLSDIPLLDL
ncbi:uncharacterized protein LOC143298351 isoform X2 [Babylonia areolata]|uniref:uncharacterized protein LOC143298351 isoform X2 n=1 Tax=Babylonia areolata TaxID=304850 RepID=UPI003FD1CBA1